MPVEVRISDIWILSTYMAREGVHVEHTWSTKKLHHHMDSHGDVAEKIYNMYVNYNIYIYIIYNIEICPSYLHISPCPVPPQMLRRGHESHGLFGCRQCRQVDNIVTEPNATSTKFLLYGTRGDTVPCCGDTVPKPPRVMWTVFEWWRLQKICCKQNGKNWRVEWNM